MSDYYKALSLGCFAPSGIALYKQYVPIRHDISIYLSNSCLSEWAWRMGYRKHQPCQKPAFYSSTFSQKMYIPTYTHTHTHTHTHTPHTPHTHTHTPTLLTFKFTAKTNKISNHPPARHLTQEHFSSIY